MFVTAGERLQMNLTLVQKAETAEEACKCVPGLGQCVILVRVRLELTRNRMDADSPHNQGI